MRRGTNQATLEAWAARKEVEMSQDKALHDHQKRIMLANSITSVLAYRFPWLHVNATAYFGKMLADGNDNGLTLEAAMGAILDALQTENEEVKRQFAAYVANHGPPTVR